VLLTFLLNLVVLVLKIMAKDMIVRKFLLAMQFAMGSFISIGYAQTGTTEDFNTNIVSSDWTGSSYYNLTEANQEMAVNVINKPSGGYNVFSYGFSALNLTADPYIKIKVKTATAIRLRIDFTDVNGYGTNAVPYTLDVAGSNTYQELTYKFAGRFNQSWPVGKVVDASQIVAVVLYVNPGGAAFNGTIYLDDLLIGSNTGIQLPTDNIKLSQIGFYPKGPKTAVVNNSSGGPFYVISSDKQDTVYAGTLGASGYFNMTDETVRQADFTSFDSAGSYFLNVHGLGYSNPFEIKDAVHHNVSKAGLKGFYYQRASTPLLAAQAGVWARAAGHPDKTVYVHNSAANGYRPTNTIISSPRGWYDAGDYNKYIVSSGISTFMLLSMYEHYASYFDTLNLNIPESGNATPDLLDEALWEIRWLLTMQDPYDGGVYSKVTSPYFDGTVMPAASTQARYVVQKSTASSLDFSATLAQAARIYKLFPSQFPGLADSCINASVKAWRWARKHPNQQYIQSLLNSPSINTGEYGDGYFGDEFQWAAMELYATTRVDSFYTLAGGLSSISPPGWADVRALGYLSLSHLRKTLTNVADTTTLKQIVIDQAHYLKGQGGINPYGTSMYDGWNFRWGSNSAAATHGVLLLNAFDMTKDSSYLKMAIADLDYLLGRNGTNYSFITGHGTTTPMDIHHRISGADGISDPVPGLMAGGPNVDDLTDCGAQAYPSSYPGKSYADASCSYSTNEIAINWNGPFSYLSNVIEAIQAGGSSKVLNYVPVLPTNKIVISDTLVYLGTMTEQNSSTFSVYPNPAKDKLNVEFNSKEDKTIITLMDLRGTILYKRENTGTGLQLESFELSGLNPGMYYLFLKSGEQNQSRKIFVE
jgi:endoglucanase